MYTIVNEQRRNDLNYRFDHSKPATVFVPVSFDSPHLLVPLPRVLFFEIRLHGQQFVRIHGRVNKIDNDRGQTGKPIC